MLEWIPEKHFCVTALIFLKKVFYMKSFENFQLVGNEDARQLYQSDKDAFLLNVRKTVKDSLSRIHDEQSPECSIRFSAPIPAHNIIRDSILGASRHEEEKLESLDSTSTPSTTVGNATKRLPFYDVTNEVSSRFSQLLVDTQFFISCFDRVLTPDNLFTIQAEDAEDREGIFNVAQSPQEGS